MSCEAEARKRVIYRVTFVGFVVNLGCPIRFVDGVKRPVADWTRIREQLVREGFLD